MAVTPLNTITITNTTTLDQLKAFQDGIGKDDAKLRGTVNKDGSITLKAVDRDSSFFSRMSGISKGRREAARAAIATVMANSGAIDRKPMGSLAALINADRSHSPKSGMLRDVVAFAKGESVAPHGKVTDSPVKKERHDAHVLSRKFPDLEAKGLSTGTLDRYMQLALDAAEKGPLTDVQVRHFANELRTDVMNQLTQKGPLGLNERMMLGVSDIEGFVSTAFARLSPGVQPGAIKDAVDRIAKDTAAQLSEALLGTKEVDDNTLQIGGETFRKKEALGEGGFGTAILYRSEASGREVVLKVPKDVTADTSQTMLDEAEFSLKAEIDAHSKIMDSSVKRYPHVLSLEGAVRLKNGMFATVTEACTSGDMAKVLGKVTDAVKSGILSPEQGMACQLTLMRDMIDGQAILAARGFSHRDIKFENVFVDARGMGKLADFGETAVGRTFNLWNQKMIANPRWLAPENLAAQAKVDLFVAETEKQRFAHLKAKVEVFNSLVGPGGAFAHLNVPAEDISKLDALPDAGNYTQRTVWTNRVSTAANRVEKTLEGLGDVGTLMKVVINDSSESEARRLQGVVDAKKAQLPVEAMVNGFAADVWSFGAAILSLNLRSDEAISLVDSSDVPTKLAEYFAAKPAPGGSLPEALEKGSFLTDKFVSQHANGTVTGDKELDALVNKTLKRKPDERPSFRDILKEPIFRRPGVGSSETRDLIAALVGKPVRTPEEIKALAKKIPV